MLTGEIPHAPAAVPSANAADARFDPIVRRATEPDRDRRYQQMREMNNDVTRLTRTPESTIRLTQFVPAPVERVFAAWTDPASMTNWYAPTDEFTTPIAEVDLRVGGTFRVGMYRVAKKEMNLVRGQYCRIDPPHTLIFTWAWDEPKPCVQETQVTLEFRPSGPGTEVTFIHERFRDEGQRQAHEEGWTGCLQRLARELAK
jgi:uncharacterized protein YndB with AHSA1/START domain